MSKFLAVFILSLLLFSSVAIAEELPKQRVAPGNPLYPLKKLYEKVQIWFAFSPEAKAALRLHYAQVRLSELNETIAKGKLQYAEKLKEDYENEINEAEKILKKTEALGRNVTALAEHVCNVTYKHVLVLERVWEKVPEQAKPAIEHAINISIEKHENCAERILTRINQTVERVKRFNCTADADCRNLFCPQVLGMDTPVCEEGKCKCGGKWEIVNKTEWKERFREEWTNETQRIVERIKEKLTIRYGECETDDDCPQPRCPGLQAKCVDGKCVIPRCLPPKGIACAQVITYKVIGKIPGKMKCYECPDACSPIEKCKEIEFDKGKCVSPIV